MLSDLALAAKGFWGYDRAFIESCRAELTFSPDDVARRHFVVADLGGRVAGFYSVDGKPPPASLATCGSGRARSAPALAGSCGRRRWPRRLLPDSSTSSSARSRTPRVSTARWAPSASGDAVWIGPWSDAAADASQGRRNALVAAIGAWPGRVCTSAGARQRTLACVVAGDGCGMALIVRLDGAGRGRSGAVGSQGLRSRAGR